MIAPAFLPQQILHPEQPAAADLSDSDDLPGSISDLAPFVTRRLREGTSELYAESLEQMERYLLTRVLQYTDGNQTQAAELLGITRGKVRDRVRQFGISLDRKVIIDD